MQEHKNTFLKSILSGIYIVIAAIIYLIVSNEVDKTIGATLFSLALLVIVNNNYNLYTGKIGYLFPYKKGNLVNILIIIFGNVFGIVLLGLLFNLTKSNNVAQYAANIMTTKLSKQWYESFILAIFCGFLMYTAVDNFTSSKSDFSKVIIVIFAVIGFILASFEHSIANITYLVLSKTASLKAFLYILIMILGNAVGAIILNLIKHFSRQEDIQNQ